MQWRWPVTLFALLILVVVSPLEAQVPEPGPGAEEPSTVEALHQVQTTDNLHLLAAYYYGDARQWVRILDTNRAAIQHPSVIHPGQILRIFLSPGWTPEENYTDWKRRVREEPPPEKITPSEAPGPPPALPKPEGSLNGGAKKKAAMDLEGGNSPQDVFHRAKAAAAKDDIHTFFRLISPDGRAQMGFAMVLAAKTTIGMKAAMEGGDGTQAQQELDALLKDHGVKNFPQGAPPVNLEDKEAVAALAQEMFAGVDVIALIEDIQAHFRKLGFQGGTMKITRSIEGELTGLKIEGDRATAMAGGKPGTFVKVNGRWYLEPVITN